MAAHGCSWWLLAAPGWPAVSWHLDVLFGVSNKYFEESYSGSRRYNFSYTLYHCFIYQWSLTYPLWLEAGIFPCILHRSNMGKSGIIDKSRVGSVKAVHAVAKYCIDRPRLFKKTTCDLHRRPLTSRWDIETAIYCCPSPVVVSPVSFPRITSVVTLEQEFGQLLRRTPEYHGLKRKELGTALSRRIAIHLSPIK